MKILFLVWTFFHTFSMGGADSEVTEEYNPDPTTAYPPTTNTPARPTTEEYQSTEEPDITPNTGTCKIENKTVKTGRIKGIGGSGSSVNDAIECLDLCSKLEDCGLVVLNKVRMECWLYKETRAKLQPTKIKDIYYPDNICPETLTGPALSEPSIMQMALTETFTAEMNDRTSAAFKDIETRICDGIKGTISILKHCECDSLTAGSVVADIVMFAEAGNESALTQGTTDLAAGIAAGTAMPGIPVDASSVKLNTINECDPNPCKNDAVCSDLIEKFECICSEGWENVTCEDDINECADTTLCENNGTCVNEDASYSCTCVTGYDGSSCQINIDDCLNSPCLNNGECVDGVDSFNCTCLPGSSGDLCEIVEEDLSDEALFKITFDETYTASLSDTTSQAFKDLETGLCTEIKAASPITSPLVSCRIVSCGEGSIVVTIAFRTYASLSASLTGYISGVITQINDGTILTSRNVKSGSVQVNDQDECSTTPCQNDGTCVDLVGEYECRCKLGTSGTNCENDDTCDWTTDQTKPCHVHVDCTTSTMSITVVGTDFGGGLSRAYAYPQDDYKNEFKTCDIDIATAGAAGSVLLTFGTDDDCLTDTRVNGIGTVSTHIFLKYGGKTFTFGKDHIAVGTCDYSIQDEFDVSITFETSFEIAEEDKTKITHTTGVDPGLSLVFKRSSDESEIASGSIIELSENLCVEFKTSSNTAINDFNIKEMTFSNGLPSESADYSSFKYIENGCLDSAAPSIIDDPIPWNDVCRNILKEQCPNKRVTCFDAFVFNGVSKLLMIKATVRKQDTAGLTSCGGRRKRRAISDDDETDTPDDSDMVGFLYFKQISEKIEMEPCKQESGYLIAAMTFGAACMISCIGSIYFYIQLKQKSKVEPLIMTPKMNKEDDFKNMEYQHFKNTDKKEESVVMIT